MLFWICLAGPLLFLIVSLILGALAPKYSHTTDEMSYLVYSRYGKWQTVNFIGSGLLTLGLAVSLIGVTSDALNNIYLIKLCAWSLGLSLILLRIFPTQLKGHKTYISTVHKSIFILSVLTQGMLQIAFARSNPDAAVATYLYISGSIVLLGIPAMYKWKNLRGLSQRALVAFIMIWVTVGALLMRT